MAQSPKVITHTLTVFVANQELAPAVFEAIGTRTFTRMVDCPEFPDVLSIKWMADTFSPQLDNAPKFYTRSTLADVFVKHVTQGMVNDLKKEFGDFKIKVSIEKTLGSFVIA